MNECDSALRAEPASQHDADKAARAWMEGHGYGNQSFGFALADLQSRIEAKDREAITLARQVHELLNHCPDAECHTCGEIICPHAYPLHFHHDGCPACAEHEAETRDQLPATRCRAEGGDTSDIWLPNLNECVEFNDPVDAAIAAHTKAGKEPA